IEPVSKGFKGNVYLLVNAANSSATFYFAELARYSKLATLVGTTTGGSQKGLNGGIMFFVRLPKTNLGFDIPIIGTYSLDNPDTGISPDIEVRETVESLRAGIDPVIVKVKELIDK
ncbi:MAG: S41 family peptidase, partial [Ignavibacteriaceae bacterium]